MSWRRQTNQSNHFNYMYKTPLKHLILFHTTKSFSQLCSFITKTKFYLNFFGHDLKEKLPKNGINKWKHVKENFLEWNRPYIKIDSVYATRTFRYVMIRNTWGFNCCIIGKSTEYSGPQYNGGQSDGQNVII